MNLAICALFFFCIFICSYAGTYLALRKLHTAKEKGQLREIVEEKVRLYFTQRVTEQIAFELSKLNPELPAPTPEPEEAPDDVSSIIEKISPDLDLKWKRMQHEQAL